MIIAVTDEEPRLVEQFIQKFKPTYPLVILKNPDFDKALGVSFFPTGAVIGTDGKLVFAGSAGEAETKLADSLSKAKKGKFVPEKFAGVMQQVRARSVAKAYAELKKVTGADKKWLDRMQQFLESEAESAISAARGSADKGFLYEATRLISGIAKSVPPFPVTKDAAEMLKSFEAAPKYKLELSGGEKYEKARELEGNGEYSKSVAAYADIIKSCAGTKISDAARKQAEGVISRGMLGYKSDCPKCQSGKKACDKHAEPAPKL